MNNQELEYLEYIKFEIIDEKKLFDSVISTGYLFCYFIYNELISADISGSDPKL